MWGFGTLGGFGTWGTWGTWGASGGLGDLGVGTLGGTWDAWGCLECFEGFGMLVGLGVQTLGGLRVLKIYLMYLGNLEIFLLSPLSILSDIK